MIRLKKTASGQKRTERASRDRPSRRTRLGFEPLESRYLLASMAWTGGDGLLWHNPANWVEVGTAPPVHRVPGAGDDVTIGAGAQIYADSDVTIRSGAVQSGGSLQFAGNLTVSDGLANAGTIKFGSRHDQILTVSHGTFLNTGNLTYHGGDYNGAIFAKLENLGTISESLGYLRINTAGEGIIDPQPVDPAFTFVNAGVIDLSNGAHCYTGGILNPHDLGAIHGNGYLAIQTVDWILDADWILPTTSVVLGLNASAVAGAGTLTVPKTQIIALAAGSVIDVNLVNHGTLIGLTASTINGQLELPDDSTLTLGFDALPFPSQFPVNEHFDPPVSLALTVTKGFTNYGTISLFDTSLGSTLNVTNGTLANAQGGIISSSRGYDSGGTGNILNADLDNRGTLAVGGSDLTIARGFTNHGTIDMSLASPHWTDLSVTNGTLVNAAGATITCQGTGIQSGASLTAQVDNQGTINVSASQLAVNPDWAPTHNRSWTFTNTGVIHTDNDGVFTLGGQFNPIQGTIDGTGGLGFEGADVQLDSDWYPALPVVVAISPSTISGSGKLVNASGHHLAIASSTINAALENHGNLWVAGWYEVGEPVPTAPVPSTINGPLTMAHGSSLLVGWDERSLIGSPLLSKVAADHLPTGGELTIASGFTNAGEIVLSALGADSMLHVTSGALVNVGTIRTSGASSSTRDNFLNGRVDNQGTISVSESDLAINYQSAGAFFPLTNEANGTIEVATDQTLTVGGTALVNQGAIQLQGNAVVDLAVASVKIAGQGSLQGEPEGTLHVRGSLLGNTQNIASHSPPGTVWLDGAGTEAEPQLLEVMQVDQGDIDAGYAASLAFGSLRLGANTYVKLVDQARNSPSTGAEAAYADTLNVPAGATLDRNRLRLYVRQSSGDGGQLNVPSPWHNYANSRDVNGNGIVTPLDALIVINYINANAGSFALPRTPTSPPRYYDVSAGPAGDGDAEVTALDVLIVVDFLNSDLAGEAEDETVVPESFQDGKACFALIVL